MEKLNLPQGHHQVMPYLILKNAEAFMPFLKKVFNAREMAMHLREGTGELMHAEARIGDGVIMYGSSNDQWAVKPAGLYTYSNNVDETYRLALDNGATSIMEPEDRGYGRTCGVHDQWGNDWWITQAE